MDYPEQGQEDTGLSTVVFDFDGTLATSRWPMSVVGTPVDRGLTALRFYFDEGFEIVIHTSRPESHQPLIWAFLRAQGLDHMIHDVVCGKPRGWLYVDDRSWNPFKEGPTLEPPASTVWDEAEVMD